MTTRHAHGSRPRPPTPERARSRIPGGARRPFRVVVGVDFSGASLAAARWVARVFGPGADLVLVNVLPAAPPAPAGVRAGRAAGPRDDALAMSGALRGLAGLLGVGRVAAVVRRGAVADALAAVAARVRARYVCIGRDAVDGLPALRLAERLLARTSAGVIVVPGTVAASPNRVVALVDGRPGSAAVLREAASVLARVAAAASRPPAPAPTADLLVLARRYRAGTEVGGTVRRGLGALDPVLRAALDRAPCPVLVVPRPTTPSDRRRRIAAGPARRGPVQTAPGGAGGGAIVRRRTFARPDLEAPMSHQNRVPQCSLPPPHTARALPPASLVLFDGDVLAAWIRGRALGFGGFPDERAAADAALVAYAALSCWADRRRYTPPPLPATLRPTLCADTCDGERWVLADRLPIARLVDARAVRVDDACATLPSALAARRSAEPDGRGVGSRARSASDGGGPHHGFEVEVPLPVDELGVRSAAYAVYLALCRSGLPWRLWDAGRRARRVHGAADDADAPAETADPRRTTPGGAMSLGIFEHGEGRFHLVRDAREIGWVDGRTICFRGYADTDAAAEAAATAYAALIRWTARQLRTGPVPHRRRRLAVLRDGVAEWLTLGGTRVARLRRFGPDDLSAAEPEVGFEIDLPAGIGGGVALNAAQALDRALRARAAGAGAPSTARRATMRAGRAADGDGARRPRVAPAADRVVERGADRREGAGAPHLTRGGHVDEPLRFVRNGPSSYHVFGGDVQLGWMDDRTIALFGYDTPDHARCAGTTAYVAAVGWHAVSDGRAGDRWRDAEAVAPEHRIEVGGAVVGRVVRTPSDGRGKERYGFELARDRGQTFAASVHQFHRLLAIGRTPSVTGAGPPGALPNAAPRGRRRRPATGGGAARGRWVHCARGRARGRAPARGGPGAHA